MNAFELTSKLKYLIDEKIEVISKSNPIINFAQPFIMRIINNKTDKIVSFLNILADEHGDIDASSLMDDIIQRIETVNPFTLDLMSISKLEIGGGKIKMGIPLTDKCLVFNTQDIQIFKDTLLNKK